MTCKYHALIYLASLLTGSLRAALADWPRTPFHVSETEIVRPYCRSGFSHGHVSGLKLAWPELTYTTAPGVLGLGLGLILLSVRLPDAPRCAVSLLFSVIYL